LSPNHLFTSKNKKAAFTLAEVLITLGIIGVIAAITIPSVVQNYKARLVEVRLKKFYTEYNEAIRRAELEYGDKKDWYLDTNSVDLDKNGNPIEGTSAVDKWFTTYLSDFIPIKKTVFKSGQVRYYLIDGSAFQYGHTNGASNVTTSRGLLFFPKNPDKCDVTRDNAGRCYFYFLYMPNGGDLAELHKNKGLEPAMYGWDGTRTQLLDRCKNSANKAFCTTLIKYDGWTVPKDYPLKLK
jgi:prepilin-type N-terminal cleavage/methylation domain-containing protein